MAQTIPNYEGFMWPVLALLADGNKRRREDIRVAIKQAYDEATLSLQEDKKLNERIGWAVTYLYHAGLLSREERSQYKITSEGYALFRTGLGELNSKYLQAHYPSFVAWLQKSEDNKKALQEQRKEAQHQSEAAASLFPAQPNEQGATSAVKPYATDSNTPNWQVAESAVAEEITPEERLTQAFHEINQELAENLLLRVKNISPQAFEQLVLDLLLLMGYGGTADSGKVTQYSRDGGIDAIIKEDKLGLDKIYIQAKRWDNGAVGRKEIQSFVGALSGQQATKGVFITTSKFTKDALQFNTGTFKVVLIDGMQLCKYMIEYNLGVSLRQSYELKRIDTDYFGEE